VERRIQYMNWIDFKNSVPRKIKTVILPMGTIEAHGIIPLGTDNIIPECLSLEIAEKINAIVAPTVNYGITRSLLPYPGSITLRESTFTKMVQEIAGGLADNGFETIIFLNGHGGHIEELKSVVHRLWQEKQTKSIIVHWWLLTEQLVRKIWGETGGHAGLDETAMIYAIDETLVRKKHLKKELAMLRKPGFRPTPFPAPIILYKDGEGFPKLDKRCKEFYDESIRLIAKEIKTTLKAFEGIDKTNRSG
jgi:creatinine amidohydrolase